MFGFYYAIYGMFFGTLCSLKAQRKQCLSKNWFTLGFIFGIFAYFVLIALPGENENINTIPVNRSGKTY